MEQHFKAWNCRWNILLTLSCTNLKRVFFLESYQMRMLTWKAWLSNQYFIRRALLTTTKPHTIFSHHHYCRTSLTYFYMNACWKKLCECKSWGQSWEYLFIGGWFYKDQVVRILAHKFDCDIMFMLALFSNQYVKSKEIGDILKRLRFFWEIRIFFTKF